MSQVAFYTETMNLLLFDIGVECSVRSEHTRAAQIESPFIGNNSNDNKIKTKPSINNGCGKTLNRFFRSFSKRHWHVRISELHHFQSLHFFPPVCI